jgi:hypothetical protein
VVPGWSTDLSRKGEKKTTRLLSRIGNRCQLRHRVHPTITHGLWGNSSDSAWQPERRRGSGPLQCFARATQGHWVRARDQAGFKSLPNPFVPLGAL